MVWHVGIDVTNQTVAYYDTLNETSHEKNFDQLFSEKSDSLLFQLIKSPRVGRSAEATEEMCEFLEDADKLFFSILFYIRMQTNEAKLGCVCIFVEPKCDNKKRRQLVERGFNYGFQIIQIFDDSRIMDYFQLISTRHIFMRLWLSEGYVIWMFNDFGLMVFKYENEKIVCAGEFSGNHWKTNEQIEDIKSKTQMNQGPNVIFHNHILKYYPFPGKFPLSLYRGFFSDCAKAALCNARIMGNETIFMNFDIHPFCNKKIEIHLDDVFIQTLTPPVSLPIKICKILNTKFAVLKINFLDQMFIYNLAEYTKAIIIFTVDLNEIFAVKFVDISKFSDIEMTPLKSICKMLPEPLKKIEISDVYSFPKKYESIHEDINAIGIDLGTSRCCCAVNRRFAIETILLDGQDKRLLPSYVAFDEAQEKCGQIVLDRLRNYANASVFDAKRIIGKKFNSLKAEKSWPFIVKQLAIEEIEPENGDNVEIIKKSRVNLIKIHERGEVAFKLPEQISGLLLKHIKEKAEEFQGTKLSEVVITVPAAFDDSQRKATILAGKLAGFEAIHLLPEPVAAAFAYFIERPIPNNSIMLLFDLGGGTLDVCIFKIENSQLKIICRSGDPNIGGRDFDNLLIDFFTNKLVNDCNVAMTDDKSCKLMLKCQTIKESLSAVLSTELNCDEIDSSLDVIIPITRDEFEAMASELLHRIEENILKATEKIDLDKREIKKVLQVGGGSRMPMIKSLLQNAFPEADQMREQNPDEVVAIGAAYYSYYLNLSNKN